VLYESTGLNGRSSIRKVRLETGEVLQKRDIPEQYFGEGIVNWKDRLIEITWQTQAGFVYDLNSFNLQRQFSYPSEGWGLTQDGKRIIMSDGTAQIRFWNPETLQEVGRLNVNDAGQPITELNELEWVKGEIYANVYQTDRIARIDPSSGKVVGWIDLTGILPASDRLRQVDVLNGIAYDAATGRLWVTGKLWPKLFEIRLVKKEQ
jgi:glutaminyl-peptide cyclotransferase